MSRRLVIRGALAFALALGAYLLLSLFSSTTAGATEPVTDPSATDESATDESATPPPSDGEATTPTAPSETEATAPAPQPSEPAAEPAVEPVPAPEPAPEPTPPAPPVVDTAPTPPVEDPVPSEMSEATAPEPPAISELVPSEEPIVVQETDSSNLTTTTSTTDSSVPELLAPPSVTAVLEAHIPLLGRPDTGGLQYHPGDGRPAVSGGASSEVATTTIASASATAPSGPVPRGSSPQRSGPVTPQSMPWNAPASSSGSASTLSGTSGELQLRLGSPLLAVIPAMALLLLYGTRFVTGEGTGRPGRLIPLPLDRPG